MLSSVSFSIANGLFARYNGYVVLTNLCLSLDDMIVQLCFVCFYSICTTIVITVETDLKILGIIQGQNLLPGLVKIVSNILFSQ